MENKNYNTKERQLVKSSLRKLHFIELKGGCCEKCGYKNNLAALEFHHINPSTKCFSIDGRKLANYSYEKLKTEIDKCSLLCSNCHREIHNEKHDMSKIIETIENYKHPIYEKVEKKKCLKCGKILCNDNISGYCQKCLKEKRQQDKNYPTKDELYKKYDELKSWNKVAEYFNITRKITQIIRQK